MSDQDPMTYRGQKIVLIEEETCQRRYVPAQESTKEFNGVSAGLAFMTMAIIALVALGVQQR